MTKGYEGLRQLLERGGVRYTGQYHLDIDNARRMMRHEQDPLPMFNPKALYLGMQQTWLKRERGDD